MTTSLTENLSDTEKEFARYLERDFEQCFQQMRHYDGQVLDILKFVFTAYAALTGAALTLYNYGIQAKIDYSTPAAALLLVGFVTGICFLASLTRNRMYYVVVVRYINEHREFFLRQRPLGFENKSEMYCDWKKPAFFHWRSTQMIFLVVLALFNAALGVGVLVVKGAIEPRGFVAMFALGAVSFAAQLAIPILYLCSREGQNVDRAAFGA